MDFYLNHLLKMKYKKLNRNKKLKPKKEKFLCKVCDSQLVWEHTKCPVCGHKNNNKRMKKIIEPENILYCNKCKKYFDYCDIDDEETGLHLICPICNNILEEISL